MPSEFEEYFEFKQFQKKNQKKSKKRKNKSKRRNGESAVFKGVTDPERIDAIDYYLEARNIEKKDALKGLYGAEKRAKSRAFNNETKSMIEAIKTVGLPQIDPLHFKYKPKTERRKNTAGAWDIPNNPAFYPEDWEKVKSGSKWAGETTIKGASAFGRGAKNVGESAFSAGKDIFAFAKENKDYFGQEKRQARSRAKQDRQRANWQKRTDDLKKQAQKRADDLKYKKEKFEADTAYKKEQDEAKIRFEQDKAQFIKDEREAKFTFDREKAKQDREFKRAEEEARHERDLYNKENPRKWYKGFRR